MGDLFRTLLDRSIKLINEADNNKLNSPDADRVTKQIYTAKKGLGKPGDIYLPPDRYKGQLLKGRKK